ncbi:MAG: TonB-dependent receptor [Bacteroidetes bacterium]|nr:TonB-dependent receptor [Bacteroidota bacterium]
MKLTIFLILFSVLGSIASDSYSQSKKLTFEMKHVTVQDILSKIEDQSEFYFLYSEKVIDVERKVSVHVENTNIEPVLDELFKGSDVAYVVKDRIIVLSSADIINETAEAVFQQSPVTGKIADEDGNPLIGVTVFVKGTTNGTVSDVNGNYQINNVPEDGTLVFSFIGLQTQEIAVDGKTQVNVTMQVTSIALDEVVAVGYGVQRKVNMTGSITSVKTEELQNIPMANLSNAMAGRAPGVTVVGNSGLAGATSDVRIRGSFAEPLYVINGILKGKADFDALDPNEVETINFLKDAASAAIYGSNAGNGVVLITTKEGKIQKPMFNYKTSYSTSRTTQPYQKYTATEELTFMNNVNVTRGQPKQFGSEIFDYFKDKNYDVNDLIWQNPSIKQHNLSVNGGSEKITYFLSMGYHDEAGSYHNTDYKRYNFRSDVTAKITDAFKVRVNLSGNQRNADRWYWPYDGAEDQRVGDWYRATFNWSRLYPFYVDEQGNPTNDTEQFPVMTGGYHPPEIMLHGGYRRSTKRTLDGIVRFDLDLGKYIKGLSTSAQGHLTSYDDNSKALVLHNNWYKFQSGSTTNKFIPGPVDPTLTAKHNLSSGYENIQERVNLGSSYQFNWYVNYNREFGDHSINAVAVYEQRESDGKYLYGRANELLSSSIDQIYNASGDTERRWFSGNESQFASASWIGRANYSFASKYIAEFSFRYDGNYKFAPEQQWGFFPSGSLAWRISEENFLQDVSWLSNLKLRGSYGTTGSVVDVNGNAIGAWNWTNTYQKTTGYVYGSSLQDGLRPGSMPNPVITWATVSNWNVGLEYGLLDNKLRGEFDIWGKTMSDILGARTGSTPSTLGASLPWENYAERSWNGFEISANWNDKVGELTYQVYANMGYAVDQWDIYDEPESYTDGTYTDNWRSRVGKPANRIFGLISKGIIRTQAELDAIPDGYTVFGRQPQIGTLLFEDIRGANYADDPDGKIDGNDNTYLSDNGAPRINYGLGLNLEWKGIAVNTHFQGVGNYDRMVSTRNGGGVFQVGRPYFALWKDNYWTPEDPNAKYPRAGANWRQHEFGGNASSFWIRKASYLRLKNLNIGYTLPSRWFNKIGLSKVQVFANGTNVFAISQYKEHDPEQATLDSYPLMKTFTGGVNINF